MRALARASTALISIMILASSACDAPPDASTVWTPPDHDRQDPAQTRQGGAQPAGGGAPQGAQFVEVAWMRACADCHGPQGRGDGPQGAMVKAPDLTDPEWQAKVKDDEIEQIIRKGKGQMPAFDIPEAGLKAFVARIRALRRPR